MSNEELKGLTDTEYFKVPNREKLALAYRLFPRVLGVLADEKPRRSDEFKEIIQQVTGSGEEFASHIAIELERQGFIVRGGHTDVTKGDRVVNVGIMYVTERGVREAWRFADEPSLIHYDRRRIQVDS